MAAPQSLTQVSSPRPWRLDKTCSFYFTSPIIGFLVAMLVTFSPVGFVRGYRPLKVDRWFRACNSSPPPHTASSRH